MTEFRPTRFEILPVVIKNLLIINVLFFLAQITFSASGASGIEDWFGLHHVKSPLFEPWQIITHLFLHGNFWHLFMNMFALWMFGSILENIWGPKRFFIFYFLCGIGAALVQLISLSSQYHDLLSDYMLLRSHMTPETIIAFYNKYPIADERTVDLITAYRVDPENTAYITSVLNDMTARTYAAISHATIGASGAVFGVLAAFIYLFPNTYIYIYFLMPIKAKWIGLIYFGTEIISAIQNRPGDNIAHWAHLGGGLVGFLLVLTWNKKNRRQFY